MNIIVCVDDNGGMLFDGKRLSKDRSIAEDIKTMLDGKPLYINEFSTDIFEGQNTIACYDFIEKASNNDYCFVEDKNINNYADKIQKVIVYKWNRKYPSDFKFTFAFNEFGFKLVDRTEFVGYSHEKITKEVYEK